jgi:hypothetical protein
MPPVGASDEVQAGFDQEQADPLLNRTDSLRPIAGRGMTSLAGVALQFGPMGVGEDVLLAVDHLSLGGGEG